eukprot:3178407-Amphidinium_carterae.1
MHFAATIYLDEGKRNMTQLIVALTAPVRKFHGLVAKNLRSVEEARRHYTAMASGSSLCEALSKTFELLQSRELWQSVQLEVVRGAKEVGITSRDDGQILCEDLMVSRAATLCMDLAGQLLKHSSLHHRAWPLKFGEYNSSPIATLALMKADWAAHKWLSDTPPTRASHQMLERSLFKDPLVEKLFKVAEHHNFEPSAELMVAHARLFGGFGQTKIVEDSFQRLRREEESDGNKEVALRR